MLVCSRDLIGQFNGAEGYRQPQGELPVLWGSDNVRPARSVAREVLTLRLVDGLGEGPKATRADFCMRGEGGVVCVGQLGEIWQG
jgi:hypothetical protein